MGKMVLAALFSLVSGVAFCQSNPGFYYGQVPTAAQWNSAFSQKQDVLNFTPLNTAGGTMTGELITAPSSTLLSGLNIPAGVAPTSPVNGDVWTTLAGLYVQINGSTVGPIGTASSVAWAAITGIDASANVEGTGLWGVDAAAGTSTMFLFQAPATIADAYNPALRVQRDASYTNNYAISAASGNGTTATFSYTGPAITPGDTIYVTGVQPYGL